MVCRVVIMTAMILKTTGSILEVLIFTSSTVQFSEVKVKAWSSHHVNAHFTACGIGNIFKLEHAHKLDNTAKFYSWLL